MTNIRRATESDIPTLHGFMEELEGQIFDYQVFEKLALENLNHSACHCFIAEIDNEPAGFVSLHTQNLLHHLGKTGEIQELYVHEKFRNSGVGKSLVEHVEKLAIELNLLEIEVTAQVKRLQTHEFYQRRGYQLSHYKFTKPKE